VANQPNQRHDVAFVIGAILGGAAGAAYGLLNAPDAGARTRALLTERGDRLAQRLADASAGSRTGGQEFGTQANAAVGSVDERIRPARASPSLAAAPRVDAGDPPLTLPDPLEPDPVVAPVDAAGSAEPDDVPVALPTAPVGAVDDRDVVLDGPRPADHTERDSRDWT
jgi:hypothetical protein